MTITGKVLDTDTGAALPGANVAIVAPSSNSDVVVSGTTSANDGSFQLELEPSQVVRISYIGYRTVYPTLREGINNEIRLEPDTYNLGEAVVTASKGLSFLAKTALFLGAVILIGGVYYLIKKA